MSNLALWASLVAIGVPFVVAIVNREKWASRTKAVVFVAVSVVAAAGTAYFQGDLTGKRWLEAGIVIVVAAAAFYRGVFKPTGVTDAVEKATG